MCGHAVVVSSVWRKTQSFSVVGVCTNIHLGVLLQTDCQVDRFPKSATGKDERIFMELFLPNTLPNLTFAARSTGQSQAREPQSFEMVGPQCKVEHVWLLCVEHSADTRDVHREGRSLVTWTWAQTCVGVPSWPPSVTQACCLEASFNFSNLLFV